jgi:hypothetical protein
MKSQSMRRLMAFMSAAIAMMSVLIEGQAQTGNTVPPRLRAPMGQYFNSNPAAWNQFLSQLPSTPAVPLQPNVLPPPPSGGTWTAVKAAPSTRLTNPLLLTDGTVIVHVSESQSWYKLTPDTNGNYATGTWKRIAELPPGYGPLYFASAVLNDGKVIIQGGEYNVPQCSATVPAWTSKGAIYDPVANTWTKVNPPNGSGWINTLSCGHGDGGIGDAPSIVLPNGRFMLSACCASPSIDAFLNENTLTYYPAAAPNTYQTEQGYALLHDGSVLTIDVWDPPSAHVYTPSTGNWSNIANTPVPLSDTCEHEMGPAVTRPDGTVVAFGALTCAGSGPTFSSPPDPTVIYNPLKHTWTMGPNVPEISTTYSSTSYQLNYSLADAPAALLPNGNILFAASPGAAPVCVRCTTPPPYYFQPPTHFFEFTSATTFPPNNSIIEVAAPLYNSSSNPSYVYNFLLLPNGQVLMTDFSNTAEVYTPSPTSFPNYAWRPIVYSVPTCVAPGDTYQLGGLQLAGLSQGAAYGDDVQGATNFPLVRIVNDATGHVFYARTYGFGTRSIAPLQPGSTNFQVAAGTETGFSRLYVVANGIPSLGMAVKVESGAVERDCGR